jgi:glycerol-3-phosphate acyltransferase PlsY
VSLQQLLFLVIAPTLVIIFHYDNIGRLLSGTERKIGQKVQIVEKPTPDTNSSSSNAQA